MSHFVVCGSNLRGINDHIFSFLFDRHANQTSEILLLESYIAY